MSIVYQGVTFGGTSLVTFVSAQPRMAFRCVRGLDEAPDVRGRDTVIPATAGLTVRNRVRHRRIIGLQGMVIGTGSTDTAQLTDFRDAMEELRALFDPTASPATLVLALEDGGTATITARTRDIMIGSDAIPIYRDVSIELEAVGADWVIA